jgi:hypothetical protein
MAGGPLIPGLREFDRPRGRRPAWVAWLIGALVVVVVLVVMAGFVGGVGPLRVLGLSTTPLDAVGYRTTPDTTVIEVAVALPPAGLCRDDEIVVTAFERSNRVEVDATVTRPRTSTCPVTSIGGDVRWVDVELASPLGARTVINVADREPVPVEPSAPL